MYFEILLLIADKIQIELKVKIRNRQVFAILQFVSSIITNFRTLYDWLVFFNGISVKSQIKTEVESNKKNHQKYVFGIEPIFEQCTCTEAAERGFTT